MTTRRSFIAASAMTAATHAFAAPKDNDIKIALIGCGGRGGNHKEDPYQLEHDALFENVRTGKVRNDADYAAHSTMMGVMGRMASYTGQVITWEQAMNSQDSLVPENITWATEPPVKPDADGWYPVATPGTTLPV